MVKFLIHRPISVLVIYLAIAALAIFSLRKIPISLLPDIDVPTINIIVDQDELSSQSIENQILGRIRQNIAQINGLVNMDSKASSGYGVVKLTFDYGKDMQLAFLEVNEWIDRAMGNFDKSIHRPLVLRSSADEIPVFYLSMYSDEVHSESDFIEFNEYIQERIRPRLEQLPEISFVDVSGISSSEVVLRFDELLLKSLGISDQFIRNAIEAANLSYGTVNIRERAYEYKIKVGEPLSSLEDIRNIRIKATDRILKLREIAEVTLEEKEAKGKYYFNGERALSLALYKNHSSQMDEVFAAVNQEIENFRSESEGLRVEMLKDQTQLLKFSIQNLKSSLLFGCVLAVGIVFFFYRNWRIPLLIALIIPVSVIISLLFYYLLGLSLNLISLSGLILGLGLMIDNGIIVLDNILQKSDLKSVEQASIVGTNEMIRPLLSSMLTTCSVFIPLIFLSGMSSALFYDQAMAISIGLIVSFLVSITLLPVLYFNFFKNKREIEVLESNFHHRFYEKAHHKVMSRPWIGILIVAILIALGIFGFMNSKFKRLPDLPEFSRNYFIDWDKTLHQDYSYARIDSLLQNIDTKPKFFDVQVGQPDFILESSYGREGNLAAVYVTFATEAELDNFENKFQNIFQRQYPNSKLFSEAEKTAFEILFPRYQTELELRLYSANRNLDEASLLDQYKKLRHIILSEKWADHIELPSQIEHIVLTENTEMLLRHDISTSQVLNGIRKNLNRENILTLNNFDRELPIVVKGQNESLETLFGAASITNTQGLTVPMKWLIDMQNHYRLKEIFADGKGQYLSIPLKAQHAEAQLQKLKSYDTQNNQIELDFKGTYFTNASLMKELLYVGLVSLLLLYFITAAQFESLRFPLIILSEIPITLSASILAIYLLGHEINIMHMIGMIVAVGIIINDSIIKIDTIQQYRRAGMSKGEAALKGGVVRLNPIIMTSLTSILALVPFFFSSELGSKLQQPLAFALIVSLLIGTLVSLFWIPLFYKMLAK